MPLINDTINNYGVKHEHLKGGRSGRAQKEKKKLIIIVMDG